MFEFPVIKTRYESLILLTNVMNKITVTSYIISVFIPNVDLSDGRFFLLQILLSLHKNIT